MAGDGGAGLLQPLLAVEAVGDELDAFLGAVGDVEQVHVFGVDVGVSLEHGVAQPVDQDLEQVVALAVDFEAGRKLEPVVVARAGLQRPVLGLEQLLANTRYRRLP